MSAACFAGTWRRVSWLARIGSVLAAMAVGVALTGSAAAFASGNDTTEPDGGQAATPVQPGDLVATDANGEPLTRESIGGVGQGPSPLAAGWAFDVWFGDVKVHMAEPEQWLDRGSSWYFGNARLTMQHDGNLVLYDRRYDNTRPRARWASGTNGSGATQMKFQFDGNLVVYTANYASAEWDTGTWDRCARMDRFPFVGLQSDSNFVVYCGIWFVYEDGREVFLATPIWATNTVF